MPPISSSNDIDKPHPTTPIVHPTMGLNTEASAALVFLILYTILFVLLLLGYLTGRLRLRSRYSIIMFHVIVRLASQATGLAFGIVGYSATDLLVAYFILYVHRFQGIDRHADTF